MRIATPDLFKRNISYFELEEFFMNGPELVMPWPLFLIYGMIALIWLEAVGPAPELQAALKLNH